MNNLRSFKNNIISCSIFSSLFVSNDGTAFACGKNSEGELGFGTKTKIFTPKVVPISKKIPMIKASSGSYHSLLLSKTHEIFGAGFNGGNRIGIKEHTEGNLLYFKKVSTSFLLEKTERIIDVLACFSHSLFLSDHFRAYSVGFNGYGQLGTKSDSIDTQHVVIKNEKVISIGGYSSFSLFLTKSNNVYSCGTTDNGKCGIIPETGVVGNASIGRDCILFPQKINFGKSIEIVKLESGSDHSVVLTKRNEIFGWGLNKDNSLGLGVEKVTNIFCGQKASFFFTQKWIYVCGDATNGFSNEPQRLFKDGNKLKDKRIIIAASGDGYRFLMTEDGVIYSKGSDLDVGRCGWGMWTSGLLGRVNGWTKIIQIKVDLKEFRIKENTIGMMMNTLWKKNVFVDVRIRIY